MKGLEPTSEQIVHVIYDLVTVCQIGDISCLRLPDGFSLFSKQCGLGVWVNGIGLRSRCGTSGDPVRGDVGYGHAACLVHIHYSANGVENRHLNLSSRGLSVSLKRGLSSTMSL